MCPECLGDITPLDLFLFNFVDIDFCWCEWCFAYTIDNMDEGYFE